MKQATIDGSEPVEIGGKKFWAAPLPFDALKRLLAAMRKAESPNTDESTLDMVTGYIDEMSDLIFLSLVRNHPDITQEFIQKNVDLRSVRVVMASLNRASGLIATGETVPGEAA